MRRYFLLAALLFATPVFAQQGYIPYAVDYGGNPDSLQRIPNGGDADFSASVDCKDGIFSAWFRIDGGDGAAMPLLDNTGSRTYVVRNTSNKLAVVLRNTAGGIIAQRFSVNTYTADGVWNHLLSSWNTEGDVPANFHLYVNDVSDKTGSSMADELIDYTRPEWGIAGNVPDTNFFNGALSEIYFAPCQYLDFSVEANRRFFITADLKPVDLGTTGYKPTGTVPIAYMRTQYNDAGNNSASGEGFTIMGAPTSTPGPVVVRNPSYTNKYPAGRNASDYDGVSDYLSRSSDLVGNVNSGVATMSFWFRMDGQDGEFNAFLANTSSNWAVYRHTDGRLVIQSVDVITLYDGKSTSTYEVGSGWHHVLFSMNSNIAGITQSYLYVDGVNVLNEETHILDPTHDWTVVDWSIAAMASVAWELEGDLAEFYFNTAEFMDLAYEPNRRLFTDTDGNPVDLGPTCSKPTGTAPILCLTFDDRNDFGLNSGTGGDFTVNGSPNWTAGCLPILAVAGRHGHGLAQGRGGRGKHTR